MCQNQKINTQIERGQREVAKAQRRYQKAIKLRAEEMLAGNAHYTAHQRQLRHLNEVVHFSRMRLNKANLRRVNLVEELEAVERRIARSQRAEREAAVRRARLEVEVDELEQGVRDTAAAELADSFAPSDPWQARTDARCDDDAV